VLTSGGLFACTLETHDGGGVILGQGLRYQHAAPYVGEALRQAGLRQLQLQPASTRDESGVAVPGLVVVAAEMRGASC
jgi:predicted TPR repeat methyltransferase